MPQPVDSLVILNQAADERRHPSPACRDPAPVGRVAGIRRIPQNDHDRQVPFHFAGRIGLVGDDPVDAQKLLNLVFDPLQGVRQVDPEPVVRAAGKVVGPLAAELFGRQVLPGKLHPQLEMGHRVGGHEELEPKEPGQQVVSYVARPHPRVPAGHELRADLIHHGIKKGAGAAGRVEDQYPRRCFAP